VWQVWRLGQKEALLAHIAALRTAPARPIGGALADLAHGGDVDFIRVTADCGPPPAGPVILRYALDADQVAWRPLVACRLAAPPYDGVVIDRGIAVALTGAMAPRLPALPAPTRVVGVLRKLPSWALGGSAAPERLAGVTTVRLSDAGALRVVARLAGLTRPAPVLFEAERESPPPPGVTPRALPPEIPNNHLAYALTWFCLAAILVWFYAAALLRRLRAR